MSADTLPVTFDIVHATRYAYTEPVSVSHHVARLSPRALTHQVRLQHALDVDPGPAVLSSHSDYFGNHTTFFAMQGAHRGLTVTARSRVHVAPRSAPAPSHTPPWEDARTPCAGADIPASHGLPCGTLDQLSGGEADGWGETRAEPTAITPCLRCSVVIRVLRPLRELRRTPSRTISARSLESVSSSQPAQAAP